MSLNVFLTPIFKFGLFFSGTSSFWAISAALTFFAVSLVSIYGLGFISTQVTADFVVRTSHQNLQHQYRHALCRKVTTFWIKYETFLTKFYSVNILGDVQQNVTKTFLIATKRRYISDKILSCWHLQAGTIKPLGAKSSKIATSDFYNMPLSRTILRLKPF